MLTGVWDAAVAELFDDLNLDINLEKMKIDTTTIIGIKISVPKGTTTS